MSIGIIRLGRPTHFLVPKGNASACGLYGSAARFAAYDGRDVTCIRCRKTNAWKQYMGEKKGGGV